jgi:hypothetical protein
MFVSHIPSLIVAVFSLLFILYMVRKNTLSLRYSILWLLIDLFIIISAIFPQVYDIVTPLVGFSSPVNFTLALFIVMLLGITLQLSWELTKSEKQVDTLAQELALTNERVSELEQDRHPEGA